MADSLPQVVADLIPVVAGRIQGAVLGVHASAASAAETAAAEAALLAVECYAPRAPTAIKREAAIRLAGWMIGSAPHATRRKTMDPSGTNLELDFHGAATGNGLRASGASSLLSRYVRRRAGAIGGVQSTARDTGADFTNPPVMRFAFAAAGDDFADTGFRWAGTANGVEMDTLPPTGSAFGFWLPGSVSRRVTAFNTVEFNRGPLIDQPELADFVHGPVMYRYGNTAGLLRYTEAPYPFDLDLPNTYSVTLAAL